MTHPSSLACDHCGRTTYWCRCGAPETTCRAIPGPVTMPTVLVFPVSPVTAEHEVRVHRTGCEPQVVATVASRSAAHQLAAVIRGALADALLVGRTQ
jgi:hypothetical protein